MRSQAAVRPTRYVGSSHTIICANQDTLVTLHHPSSVTHLRGLQTCGSCYIKKFRALVRRRGSTSKVTMCAFMYSSRIIYFFQYFL